MACPGCLEGCNNLFAVLEEQPSSTEIILDGIFIKTLVLPFVGSLVPQHAHENAHITEFVSGAVRAWCNGKLLGDFYAPSSLVVPAGEMHHFQTLVADTKLVCIHDVSSQPVRVVAENSAPGAG